MSLFFSRVQLQDYPQDMALLASLSAHGEAYRDHALIWRLFPGDGHARDFIFRREADARGKPYYYVVSARLPQAEPGLHLVQTKPYAPQLEEGQWLRFDLRANPTVSRRDPDQTRSRRHDVLMQAHKQDQADGLSPDGRAARGEAAALAWLTQRAPAWGLAVAADSVLAEGYTQHRLRHKGRNIAFSSLDYLGMAQVTDPALAAKALVAGVGHARGFGCGLLLVKRVDG
jgi:CRISPR system Cascade subunit CasE